jgi:hypothetical protein
MRFDLLNPTNFLATKRSQPPILLFIFSALALKQNPPHYVKTLQSA